MTIGDGITYASFWAAVTIISVVWMVLRHKSKAHTPITTGGKGNG
jgi:hypothetical protein